MPHAEKSAGRRAEHGEARKGQETPEYRSWSHMKNRCLNTNNAAYAYYGGRGIRVCDRWVASFPAFLADMGRRPSSKHSIDRIDNNGHYEPGNCRWATMAEQTSNRRRNRPLTLDGETRLLKEWAEIFGVRGSVIQRRLDRLGWPVEAALSIPAGEAGRYLRGRDRKTHCTNGHEYTPENSGRDSAGWRFCRICNRRRSLEYMRAQRARKAC